MMHKIARNLNGYGCFFTPFYADSLLRQFGQKGWLDFTILGGKHRRNTENYLAQENLPVDFGGQSRRYDLVVTCTDILIQENIVGSRLVLVQEGITVPEGLLYYLVRYSRFPRFLANTAATGLSNAFDTFCVASNGYKDLFIQKGVNPKKITVTGIPNFDHAVSYLENDFPHDNFILATTSSGRETLMRVDRIGFLHYVKWIASGHKVIFKLHPNENIGRAKREIQEIIPEALIYSEGNVHHMIAKCSAMVTEFSSVVFTGLALGKKIYANFDLDKIRHLTPLQNGGTSAQNIASVCEQLLGQPIRQAQSPGWSLNRLFKWPARLSGYNDSMS
jgi:hypothetical protein